MDQRLTGRPGYAALKAAGSYWSLLVWLWIFSQPGWGTLFRGNPFQLVFLVMALIPILLTFGVRGMLRQKLTRELRLIAAAPVPARGDARFKKWDPHQIFPPDPMRDLLPNPRAARRSNEPRGRMDTLNG